MLQILRWKNRSRRVSRRQQWGWMGLVLTLLTNLLITLLPNPLPQVSSPAFGADRPLSPPPIDVSRSVQLNPRSASGISLPFPMASVASPPVDVGLGASIASEQQGLAELSTGNWRDAEAALTAALARYRQQGDWDGQARCLCHLALVAQLRGDMTAGLAWLDQARPLARTPRSQAQLLMSAGSLAFARGQAQAAHASWQQATVLYQQLGLRDERLRSQLNQVQALQSLGFLPRALALLEEMAPAIAAAPPELGSIVALNYGQVLQRSGRLADAEGWYRQSLALGAAPTRALALVGLGAIALGSKDPAKVEVGLQQLNAAIALAPLSLTAIQAELLQLRRSVDLADRDPFDRQWPRIQAALNAMVPDHRSLYQQIELVQILMAWPDGTARLDAAIADLLQTSQRQAEAVGDALALAYSLGLQGQRAEQAGQWAQAESLTSHALRISEPLQSPEITYRWQWQLGRLLSPRHPNQAIAAYWRAITDLRQVHKVLVDHNPDPNFSFSRDVEPVYHELLGLLLPAGPLTRLPMALSQQTETLIQEMRGVELDFYLQQGCDPPSGPTNLAQIDAKAAVVYPIVLADRLAVLLRLADGTSYSYSAAVNRSDLAKHLDRLRQDLVTRSRFRFLPGSQQLYQWLLAPAEAELARHGVKTLVFVPDGLLQTVPMTALHDGKQYLIERYAVAMSPSRPDAAPMAATPHEALAVGLTQARHGFSPLKFVADELDSIRQMMPNSSIFLDEGFTGEALQSLLERSRMPIVHIATHGQFSSTLENTFLLAWDRRILLRQIESLVRGRQTPLELLVLSACETATGDDRAVLGLAGIALQAGAKSTLATLWSVNDEASAAFVHELYGNLAKPGTSRVEALRQAQLSLLQSADYGHPLYWAPYVLLGSWL